MRGQTTQIAERSANANTISVKHQTTERKRDVVILPVTEPEVITPVVDVPLISLAETEVTPQAQEQARDAPAESSPGPISTTTGKIVAGTIIGVAVLATVGAAAVAVRNNRRKRFNVVDQDDMVRTEVDGFAQTPFQEEALPEEERDL